MKDARILIVEDEAIVAADLEDRLQHLGYTVVGKAVSAEEAWVGAASLNWTIDRLKIGGMLLD